MSGALSLAALSSLQPAEVTALLGRDAGHTAQLVYDAACLGLVEAQTTLGQMLLDGRGTPADAQAARRWFTVAAEAGYAPAANMLGRCLERGWGGDPDMVQAAHWYRHAAEGGLDWGQYNLANMVLRGRGLARDVPWAFRLFLAAARQGHAKSMNMVARFLEEGWIGPIDQAQAVSWYQCAAEGGDFRAQFNLATLLVQMGRMLEALQWFTQAGEKGSLDFRRVAADHLLARAEPELREAGLKIAARCCEDGGGEDFHRYGTAVAGAGNKRLAALLLRRAVEAGHPDSAAELAHLSGELRREGRSRWLRRVVWRLRGHGGA